MNSEQEKIDNNGSTSFQSISNRDDAEIYEISKIEFNKEELSKTLQMTNAWVSGM